MRSDPGPVAAPGLHTGRVPLCILLLFAPALLAAQQRAPHGVTITGRVTVAATAEPVPNALVALEAGAPATRTDSVGRYQLVGVPPGPQVLIVRSIGFAPTRVPLTVGTEGTITRDVSLARSALTLQRVTVTAEPTGRARGELGTASVIDRDAIANQSATSLAGVLELTPGVAVAPPGLDGVQQFSIRTAPIPTGGPASPLGPGAADLASFGTAIIMDGVPLSNNANLQSAGPRAELVLPSSAGGGIDLRRIPASTLERVEVIRGIPSARWGDLTQGAVIVDTRAGEVAPELVARYDPATVEASFVGGHAMAGGLQALSGTFDIARTRASPLRDDRASRVDAHVAHRWSSAPVTGAADAALPWVLDSRADFSQLYADNPEEPNVLPGYANASHDRSLRLNERLSGPGPRGTHFALTGALDVTQQRGFTQSLMTRGAQPFTDRLTSGRAIGHFIGGQYLADVKIDGTPWLLYSRAELTAAPRRFGFDHHLTAGGELRREWNAGAGFQYDVEFPPQSFFNGVAGFDRPRRYDAAPPVPTSGWYLDDRLLRIFPHNVSLEVQGGLRADVLHRGRWWLSKSRDAVLEPRLTAQLSPRPWLRLRGGIGNTAKLPSLGALSPPPEYYDVVNVNWYTSDPVERLAVLTTFLRNPTNADLGWSVSHQREAGVEVDVGHTGGVISVVAYRNTVMGGAGFASIPDVITREHYALSDSTIGTGQPPTIVEPATSVDTLPIIINRPSNDLTLLTRGVEMTAFFPEVTAIRTQLAVQGSWARSWFSVADIQFSQSQIDGIQLQSNIARIPYWQGFERFGERSLVTWRVIHHQPRLGLVITAVVQQDLKQVSRDIGATDTLAFVGYLTRDGQLVPVPPGDRTLPQYADIRRARVGLLPQPAAAPGDWLLSLQVAKTLPGDGRLSLYAFNVLNRVGQYERAGSTARLYPSVRFGLEVTLPGGAFAEMLR